MELLFLLILILLMVTALTAGFPVAFALPGSAILAIALAALCGYLFAGDVSAYFAQDGPIQWLSAGVTNFRSLYWLVERDTLIAIPLFIFMGIMLQRSKIAEDLLVAMAQLFGPIPGGLGISVVLVGALLAATTGIVGATVIAMGLISLPAMLRNNYSHSLATGTICASGTLGQIIPPSIVLIILADQLSNAASQASTIRKAEYTAATGEFSMPSGLDVVSASAGDMFMGALVPGVILVGLYVGYILISALINPKAAPPVPYEGKSGRKYDGTFAISMFLALTPPLILIIGVLGSILSGVATVNQAGAIGSIGAMLMGSYRLTAGKKGSYWPMLLAIITVVGIAIISNINPVNVKNIKTTSDLVATITLTFFVIGLFVSIFWSLIRIYKIQDTLRQVMAETAKMTSMVFIILLGAAMLTSAFRAFGGEELIKHFLTGLPGGFWTQFIVVMLVIFLLGFFLDFIEIAVVVVPLVAPILLSNPEANITAVWFGVMVGLNMQTSFLTPPFGFALFYLRGVAPPTVKTIRIYKGVSAFILLQLLGLAIAGYNPSLVNYLPNRMQLTSENAPPPINPRLQYCIEEYVFQKYALDEPNIRQSIASIAVADVSDLPPDLRDNLLQANNEAEKVFDYVADVRAAEAAVADYVVEYKPMHRTVRRKQRSMTIINKKIERLEQNQRRLQEDEGSPKAQEALSATLDRLKRERASIERTMPSDWETAREGFNTLATTEKKARQAYRTHVDDTYEPVAKLITLVAATADLAAYEQELRSLEALIASATTKVLADTALVESVMAQLKASESRLIKIPGTRHIKSKLYNVRRALKKAEPDKSQAFYAEATVLYVTELHWRQRAGKALLPLLQTHEAVLRETIGVRMQPRLSLEQAKFVATCQSVHRDVSLYF